MHKELFWKFWQRYLDGSNSKQTTSKTITAEKVQNIEVQKIKDILKGVKRDKLELLHYPEFQLKDVLCYICSSQLAIQY